MAKYKINVKGPIVPNSYKWYYDWMEMDCACPSMVSQVLDKVVDGDEIEVFINSPGGVIDVGSEIYTLLHQHAEKVKIYITGEACSAASIIAMAAYSEMSPTALMMVHCVSTSVGGNHNDMEHMAEVLRTADEALCTAYMNKAGITKEEALDMMEKETWLTAEQAKEKGLVDAVMFEEKEEQATLVDGPLFTLPSNEQMESVKKMIQKESDDAETVLNKEAATKLRFLSMKEK